MNEVSAALKTLQQDGLQDDSRFAESYCYHRVQRGYGPNRLRVELLERGVAESLVDETIENGEFDWLLLVEQCWRKKFGRPPADFREKAKHARFLEYRGFPSSIIMRFLSRLKDNETIEI